MNYAPKIVLQLPISNPELLDSFVEDCLRDGVSPIAVVGDGATQIEDIIDELIVGDGSDRSRFITTSSHQNETLDEVLAFARLYDQDLSQAVQLVKL
ncbi:hypothetical protein [Bradyrhizobium sp. STM 3557]|uniref:hypothetical protein n=1 Tax=Bradyrhizobium sp. STM 3557 TaxID=578920 RepID=UPI00388F55C8